MSLEAYALCHRPLNSIAEWQAAIDAAGFDLKLDPDYDIAAPSGHLPADRGGDEAGFECGTISQPDLEEAGDDLDLGGPWARIYAFYFTSMPSLAGTWIAVAACLSITGGMALDAEEGVLLSADEAMAQGRKLVAFVDEEAARSSA